MPGYTNANCESGLTIYKMYERVLRDNYNDYGHFYMEGYGQMSGQLRCVQSGQIWLSSYQ